MQLHPFYATVSRPVYWDRDGNLFKLVTCPECKGEGDFERCAPIPWHPSVYERCECCNGDGEVFEEISEDEIINNNKEKAA